MVRIVADDGTQFEAGCDHIGFYFRGGGALMREYRERLRPGCEHYRSLAHWGEGGDEKLYMKALRSFLYSKEAQDFYSNDSRYKKLLKIAAISEPVNSRLRRYVEDKDPLVKCYLGKFIGDFLVKGTFIVQEDESCNVYCGARGIASNGGWRANVNASLSHPQEGIRSFEGSLSGVSPVKGDFSINLSFTV